ncbi:MAG: rod shape-determining protein MreD [Acidimicrobiales bacterium]|jgi:rod shape-determining protein MreD
MSAGNWFRVAVVIFLALLVQQALLVDITVAREHPDIMFLLPVAAGYVGGPGRGTVIGFLSGLAADLLLPTTFGMSALVGALVAYGVGVATLSLVRSSPALQVVTGAVGTAAGMCLYAILGAILGSPNMLKVNLVPALVVATPAAAILAVPVMYLMRWAVKSRSTTDRVSATSW